MIKTVYKRYEVTPLRIKRSYVSPKGILFAQCEGCQSWMQFSKLHPTYVNTGFGRKFIDGIKIEKNGRITYKGERWQNFRKRELQHRCFNCR